MARNRPYGSDPDASAHNNPTTGDQAVSPDVEAALSETNVANDTGDLLTGDRRRSAPARPVDPRRRPFEFVWCEPAATDLDENLTRRRVGDGGFLEDDAFGAAGLMGA